MSISFFYFYEPAAKEVKQMLYGDELISDSDEEFADQMFNWEPAE